MEKILNFRQFMTNAASLLAHGQGDASDSGVSVEMPTTTTRDAVRVFKVARKGQTYEIHAENNVSWNCPAPHYLHLLRAGKAPRVGDKIKMEFYKNGGVKSYDIVGR